MPPLHPPPDSCLLLTCVLPLTPSAHLQDVAELESRLGRKLEKAERARIGVGQLRRFLEHLLQRRYLEVRGRRGAVAAGLPARLSFHGWMGGGTGISLQHSPPCTPFCAAECAHHRAGAGEGVPQREPAAGGDAGGAERPAPGEAQGGWAMGWFATQWEGR